VAKIITSLKSNTTPRGYDEVMYLINFTTNAVNTICKKKLEQRDYDINIDVELYKTPKSYKGKSFGRKVKVYTNFKPVNYPASNVYGRYTNMPKEKFNNWQEAFVGVLAHELAHEFYNGNREGEFQCELVCHDAVNMFRKEKKYWTMLPKFEKKTKAATKKVIKKKYGPSSAVELRKLMKEKGITKSPQFASYNFYLDAPKGFMFETGSTCLWCEDSADGLDRIKDNELVPKTE